MAGRITAVDGTVIETVKRVAELAWTPMAGGKKLSAYRLHTHFEVLAGKAVRIDATSANTRGDADERAVLERTVETDRCYVIDRGYAKFGLWNAIHAVGSSYVCRVRDQMVWYYLIGLASLKELEAVIASRTEPAPAQPRPHEARRVRCCAVEGRTQRGAAHPLERGYGSKRSQDGEAQRTRSERRPGGP